MIASLALGDRVRELERKLAEALAAKEKAEAACAERVYDAALAAKALERDRCG